MSELKAIIQHLRFPFSLLLLPVFLFAVSENSFSNNLLANSLLLLFFILHVLVYPSSNAYNSLQDNDEGSIGLIEKPLAVPSSIAIITLALDILALVLCLSFENWPAVLGLVLSYILFSRLYSYRKIRLKKYPIIGFLTVFIFQGFIIFMIVEKTLGFTNHYAMAFASSCLIGSMYPLSQIYQHKQDALDGVRTLSMKLGYVGTFIFSALLFAIGSAIIISSYYFENRDAAIFTYIISTAPVMAFFLYWFNKVRLRTSAANYKNTMIINLLSCICLNICFSIIIFFKF
jgi:1,4-dihydroxy-2-naphthoate polyprenyltransferase